MMMTAVLYENVLQCACDHYETMAWQRVRLESSQRTSVLILSRSTGLRVMYTLRLLFYHSLLHIIIYFGTLSRSRICSGIPLSEFRSHWPPAYILKLIRLANMCTTFFNGSNFPLLIITIISSLEDYERSYLFHLAICGAKRRSASPRVVCSFCRFIQTDGRLRFKPSEILRPLKLVYTT